MEIDALEALLRLAVALALGAVIGAERQWRQRMAGLRTNALVALGAAAFLSSALSRPAMPAPRASRRRWSPASASSERGDPARGLNIRGLNTAATALWCSAAIGVVCGAGALVLAAGLAVLVLAANLGLRPLVRLIDRQPQAGAGWSTTTPWR